MLGRAAFLAAVVAIATPASAQMEFDLQKVAPTRFGDLRVMQDGDLERLALGSRLLDLPLHPIWWVRDVWPIAPEATDWALVSWHSGGAPCDGGWHMVRINVDGAAMSADIGRCEGRMLDLRYGAEAMEIDLEDSSFAVSHVTYVWDGREMSRTPHPAADVPPAGAGEDVTRWIGEHPYLPYRDRAEQLRFATIMDPSEVEELFGLIGPAGDAVQRGDWVFGAGCKAHDCPSAGGRWGLRISDGAVVAAMVAGEQGLRLFGELATGPEFQAWLEENPL